MSGKDKYWDWSKGEEPPVARDHTQARVTLTGDYVTRYVEITASAAARRGADEYRCAIVDAFSGGGVFRNPEGEIIDGTPLAAITGAKAGFANAVAANPRTKGKAPLKPDLRFWFNDIEPKTVAFLKETLAERGHRVDGEKTVVTQGAFSEHLTAMIRWVRPTSRYTGKSIWILDQTGYSHVAAEDVARILTIPKAEVVMTISAGRMFRRGRGLKQNEWREALKRYSFLSDDILEMLRNWEETKLSRPALMRILLPRTIAKTRPRTFSCFTLSPGNGRNAVWVLHLVRSNDVEGAIRAQDAMLDCQWRQNGRVLVRDTRLRQVAGAPAQSLGFHGLRKEDVPQRMLDMELGDAERVDGRRQWAEEAWEKHVIPKRQTTGITVRDVLDRTRNESAFTTKDRIEGLTEVWHMRGADDGIECINPKGKTISLVTNRPLGHDDLLIGNLQISLFEE